MTEGLFRLALKTAYAYNGDGYSRGRGWRCVLRPVVALFDVTLFRKVRKAFGGELRFFVGGGALLDAELQRFFYAVGMPMFQGYGLSEATPVISTNSPRPRKCRFGSSGTLVQPLDCRILDEEGREVPLGQRGQIVVRGENVMAGYWKNPEATADTVRDGWLHTGDMGYLTDDGFLYVLGRFKSLLIASDGEKYSPEGMEEAIADASQLIDQIIVHNNQNPYTVAIVVPNRDELRRRYQTCGNDLAALAREVAGEIDAFRAGGVHAGEFPDRWLPSAVAIVDEAFTEQNGLVNSTMKVVRSRVEEHFRDRLDALYTPEGKRPDSAQNLSSLKNWWNKASLTEIRGRIVAVRPRSVYRRSLPHTIRRRDRSQNRNSRPAKILWHRTVPSQQPVFSRPVPTDRDIVQKLCVERRILPAGTVQQDNTIRSIPIFFSGDAP